MEKDKTVVVKKVIVAVMAVLVITYIISVVLKANFTQVKTETANVMTVSDSIPVKGYFIRDEKVVSHDGDGYISYLLSDGDKISKNEPVANVFVNADAAIDKQTIDRLDEQINSLKQLDKAAGVISVSPDELDKNIYTILSSVNRNVNEKSFIDADKNLNEALYYINERQLVTGKTESFAPKINELEKESRELKKEYNSSKKNKAITSPDTGYFCCSADGYENVLKTSDLGDIQVGDFSSGKYKKQDVDKNVLGKIMSGVYWYVACEVKSEDVLKIKTSDSLFLDIPTADNDKIAVELYDVNQKTKTSDAVVILRGNYINSEIVKLRTEDISIILNTYKGIYVSKNAVHQRQVTETVTDKNGKKSEVTKTVTGVYIQLGNEILFKQIVPLFTGDDYVICKQDPDDEELVTDEFGILKAFDEVVVEGANLYDGKIIDRAT